MGPVEYDKFARLQIDRFKIRWGSTIQSLKEIRLHPKHFQIYTNEFSEEKKAYIRSYVDKIDEELLNESLTTFKILSNDLHLALSKSVQNYEDKRHKRRMEILHAIAPILAIVVMIILIVVVKYLFNIEISVH
ncbi:hypothetical protein [Methanoregula sp.]|uniref:hypothetical protein n=1 Tax=Methanoregula sp. TaxID=2052170 RepID=UPI003C72E2CF